MLIGRRDSIPGMHSFIDIKQHAVTQGIAPFCCGIETIDSIQVVYCKLITCIYTMLIFRVSNPSANSGCESILQGINLSLSRAERNGIAAAVATARFFQDMFCIGRFRSVYKELHADRETGC